MNTDIVAYYKERAEEYENIYLKPERQEDLKNAIKILPDIFAGKSVLEVACGTGYWTEKISGKAASVYATDINDTVLEIARQKKYAGSNVTFGLADIFNMPKKNKYESLFGGFIWSHIKLQDIDRFLEAVHQLVLPGGDIVFMDNNFVESSNLPITMTDSEGNTYQTRKLRDGTIHQVLKNFPLEDFLKAKLNGLANDIHIVQLKYYWILKYTVQGNA